MASTTARGLPPPDEVSGELRVLVARLRQLLVDGTRLGTLGNPLVKPAPPPAGAAAPGGGLVAAL